MQLLLSCISQCNECNVNQSSLIKLLERGCSTKNFEKKCTIEDLSTLRDISLLPVCYKILSKAICYNNNNNNNNNSEINSSNKNSTINKDTVISPSQSQISKETVFIQGDSMVKKLNGFLLTRKLKK